MTEHLPALQDLTEVIISKGSDIINDPDAEYYITWLLAVNKWSVETINKLKEAIAEKAVATDPNFTGVRGKDISVEYRHYGPLYKLSKDFDPEKDFDPAIMKLVERYTIDSKAVDNFVANTNSLPAGVEKTDRPKSITFKETK